MIYCAFSVMSILPYLDCHAIFNVVHEDLSPSCHAKESFWKKNN